MKLAFLIGSLLLCSVLCQNTGIAITGTSTTGGTGTTTGIVTGVITGVSTGTPGITSGSSDVPQNGYLLFGPFAGPINNLTATFTVTSGAPVDVGIMTTANYQQFLSGASPVFEFTQNNQQNVNLPDTVINSGTDVYFLVGNNLINSTAAGQASTVSYSFEGVSTTVGVLAVNSRPTPTTTGTTGTTGAAGSSSGTVNIQTNEYYYWTIPGAISGASATFGVSGGAPIDILFLVDNNFNLFQGGQAYVSLFRNLSTSSASFLNLNVASGSTLYIVIGNSLQNLAASSLASAVQYQLTGFPPTATLTPTRIVRTPSNATTGTTGVIITGAATTGTTGTAGNTVTINNNQFSLWTATGPVTGASASFTVTSGSPIDVLLLVDQNFNLFLNGQPFERAYQVINVQSTVASPINLNSGSTLYILVGNSLVSGGTPATSTVQYTLNGFPTGQLTGPTMTNRPGAGVITTSTPQPSSSSTVVAQWVLAILCAVGAAAFF